MESGFGWHYWYFANDENKMFFKMVVTKGTTFSSHFLENLSFASNISAWFETFLSSRKNHPLSVILSDFGRLDLLFQINNNKVLFVSFIQFYQMYNDILNAIM